MTLSGEWRKFGEFDVVLIVDDDTNTVREALTANPEVLSHFLTETGDLAAWRGGHQVDGEKRRPGAWGQLVMARAGTGEVLAVDPEEFWGGIYFWFRSRGVDYDTARRRGN